MRSSAVTETKPDVANESKQPRVTPHSRQRRKRSRTHSDTLEQLLADHDNEKGELERKRLDFEMEKTNKDFELRRLELNRRMEHEQAQRAAAEATQARQHDIEMERIRLQQKELDANIANNERLALAREEEQKLRMKELEATIANNERMAKIENNKLEVMMMELKKKLQG